MKKFIIIALALCSLCCFHIQAKTLWSDYSVTFLSGNDYEAGDPDRTVITFEYASGTSWGDNFMFFDRLKSDNGDLETYGEWSPRIKITDFDQGSFIKSIYVAPSIEMGTSFGAEDFSGFAFNNYLFGIGSDLNIAGFDYFQLNAYARNNDFGDNNQQITLVWGVPLGSLYYDGFMDYTTSTNDREYSMNFTSQLKYDLAPYIDLSSKLYLGIEYVFWLNKFGINGLDEKNLNLLIKYHF